ncbi:MAG: ATP-binding cassette domain-containing protein, partial [Euryarchaeota archaeon]|nr:ATP-binding cassette domain-containing protein [Euryarchaeota archaeon]
HLSGGEKKRVAIAGILAMKPEIMVLDEPTTGLDPLGGDMIMNILYKLNHEKMTIIIASHDVELVTLFANNIYVLHDGVIIGEGSPEEVFTNLKLLRKAHLKPPRAADLLYRLKNDGIPVEIKLTVKEAHHELLRLLGED